MIRPLFIISDLEMGGAQRVVLTITRHLKRRGLQPELALVSENGPLSCELPDDIPVHRLKARRVRYAFSKILRLCRALQPDAVISTVGHLNILLLLSKPFLPRHTAVIVREANTPSIRLLHTRHPSLYRLAYRTLYPLCDRLICNCSYMKKDMCAHFGVSSSRTWVVPNLVDVEGITNKVLSAENPYHDNAIQLAAVGRMDHQKGYDLLLRAFQKSLKLLRNNIRLTLVGDGPQRHSLVGLARQLGISESVSFAGQKKNPYPYMAHADLTVSSSRWEGSPNVVLESLACGTPVLAFDCPGGTAEIIGDGRNGWLVPAGNWKRMGEKIAQTVTEKSWLAMKGKDLLPPKHRCENVVEQWVGILEALRRNDG
jgi:glycosyltransferase involved in cell wall biosynthesis